MPTVQDTARLLDLKKRIENMLPADRLRLAAGLIERGEYEIAEVLISDELRAVRLFRATK